MWLLFILFIWFNKIVSATETNENEAQSNAFVTFHVHDRKIAFNVDSIQREFLQKDARFLHTFQPIRSLHLTLLFIQLDEGNLENAKKALFTAASKYRMAKGHLRLRYRGIAHNKNASVYAAPEVGEGFQRVAMLHGLVLSEFKKRGIPSLNPFHEAFNPHTTILSLTNQSDQQLIKWWPGEEHKWHGKWLGTEQVKTIQICNYTMDLVTHDYTVFYEAAIDKNV